MTAIRQVDPTSLPGGCETDVSSPLPASALLQPVLDGGAGGGRREPPVTTRPSLIVAVFYTPAD